jgi:short-subunit dehydrogenase
MDGERSVAVVTGASSGIGAALAERLARDGRDLVIVARRKERLEALAKRLEAETGVSVEVMCIDLTDAERLLDLETRIAGDPRVDLLVNNAGFGAYGPFAELKPQFADDLINVHVRAPMRLTHAALPGMITRGRGAIVNVASLLALSGPLHSRMSGKATYAATKSFLLTFTQALAVELEGTGVHAMAVLPGMVETEFFEKRRGVQPTPATMMSAADVAQAVVVGLQLKEVICVPGLEITTLFEALRDIQKSTLFGGTSGKLAERYRA